MPPIDLNTLMSIRSKILMIRTNGILEIFPRATCT